jgi:hypothetical protein
MVIAGGNMQQGTDSSRGSRGAANSTTDERLVEDDRATTPPAGTRQAESDARDKHRHDKSENELPSSQEKNPVPPGTTRR